MKKWILTMVCLVVFATTMSAQVPLFQKYAQKKGVSTVYISKAMLGMMPDMEVNDHNIGRIASKLDGLRILNCEQSGLATAIAKDAMEYYRKASYEEMMDQSEDGERNVIYMKSLGKGKYEYALLSMEHNEVNIIYIVGRATLKDIKDLTD
jgi:hypothetical protein